MGDSSFKGMKLSKLPSRYGDLGGDAIAGTQLRKKGEERNTKNEVEVEI